MSIVEIGIDQEIIKEINYCMKTGFEFIGLELTTMPLEVIESISCFIDKWQSNKSTADQEKLFDIALGLGTAWGDAVCKELGWEWTQIKAEGQDYFVVCSSDRSYAFNPTHNFLALLANHERDNCSLLVVSMVKESQYPASKPGDFLMLNF